MKFCPKCGGIVNFNSYFGADICTNCDFKDDSYRKKRDKELRNLGIIDDRIQEVIT